MDRDGNDQAAPAPRKRTGGRSARVRAAILAATLDQAAEHGIEGLAIGDVAARAGVAETTIYRRWGTRTALIAEAITEFAATGNPAPDTGALRTDLRQLAEQIAELLTRPGITRLLGSTLALSTDPDIDAARHHFWTTRFTHTTPLVTRAITRGELPPTIDPRALLETLAAPLYFRILTGDQPVDAPFLARCVDNTLTLHGAAG
ncbi:TetR/AcrR family transcriptional regulator [Nocardia sp. SSK8]|uniref:TetR/AcrR family transcriptional regulator n=1 Tax=Nocardia sp. SSK8 TaxID=3120154 RepID=UPI0030093F0E